MFPMTHAESISTTLTFATPAERVFSVLADPTTHAAIDGTGWVQEPLDREPLTEVGQLFGMNMYYAGSADPDYQVVNKIVAFDRPHTIAWITGSCQADAEPEFGGWVWRYDITPIGPDQAEVTLSYDWSAVPQHIRDRGIQFPPFGPEHLPNSLGHLAELAAAVSPV
jgi:uncharacterized protein YndB with AHSA1/START domain